MNIIDLSNPEIQKFIMEGGAILVSLLLFARMMLTFINTQAKRDKQENEIFKLVLIDIKQALNRSADAQERGNEVVSELKEYIKEAQDRQDKALIMIDKRLSNVEGKMDGVIATVKILSKKNSGAEE